MHIKNLAHTAVCTGHPLSINIHLTPQLTTYSGISHTCLDPKKLHIFCMATQQYYKCFLHTAKSRNHKWFCEITFYILVIS